jgi:hypothetical protein
MGAASLIEVYHLVIFHGIPMLVEMIRILFAMRDDMSEEGHSLIALPNPEGKIHGTHVIKLAGTTGTEQQREDTQQVCHNGCKCTK